MAEDEKTTADHDGVTWSISDDAVTIEWWDHEEGEWVEWEGQDGPQPPRRFLKRWRVALVDDVEKRIEQVENDGIRWARLFADPREIFLWDEKQGEWLPWDGLSEHRPPREWLLSGQGQDLARRARLAKESGLKLFQVVIPVTVTGNAMFSGLPMFAAPKGRRTALVQHEDVLDAIENEGWHLAHAGYVFQPSGSTSRDRFILTGQVQTTIGACRHLHPSLRNRPRLVTWLTRSTRTPTSALIYRRSARRR